MPLRLTFLGSGSSYPTSSRGVSCTCVTYETTNLSVISLVDCGEGSQLQMRKSALRMGKIGYIFITHLHGDHVFGLPGILASLVAQDVHVFGPLGLLQLVNTNLMLTDTRLEVDVHVHEIVREEEEELLTSSKSLTLHERIVSASRVTSSSASNPTWTLLSFRGLTVRAGFLLHRIPCFGYVFEELDQPGTLDVEKALRLGVQRGPDLGRLKGGQDVLNSEGQIVKCEDILGPKKKGQKVVVLGDTKDASAMDHLMFDCDLLIHETTMEEALRSKAIIYGHSTPFMAVQKALDVRAKMLCLTHFSQRYKPLGDQDGLSVQLLLDEAQRFLEDKCYTQQSCRVKPNIILADDFKEIVI